MSLGQAFRVYNLVSASTFFFFSLSTSSIQRKMWSVRFLLLQLGLPLPSVSFFGHGIKTIPSQGLQRKKECYYDLDLK